MIQSSGSIRGGETIFNQVKLTGEDKRFTVDERTVNMYKNMTNEQFRPYPRRYLIIMTYDINVKLRRMLTIEQYRNPDIALLFRQISFGDSIIFKRSCSAR